MTSYNKRKQQVNELRKAHFPFGFESTQKYIEDNKNAESEYVEKYRQYELKLAQQKAENARKVNLSIADPSGHTNYTSEFKERYPEHELAAREQLNKNGGQKNFVFGYDGQGYNTNYKDDYNKKQAPHEKAKPVDAREPHINLGDSLSDFTTTYNQVHNPKQATKVVGKDPQLIRQSNMILGNDKSNYETQNNSTFVSKPITNYHSIQKSNASNINFGGDKIGYNSQNKYNFAHKDSGYQPVDQNRIRDFRSSHFQFGFPDQANHMSQARSNYNEKPIQFKKAQGNKQSNLNFNVDGNNYFNSTYNNEFTGKNGGRPDPIIKQGQIDNVIVGMQNDPDQYKSEAKSQFGSKDLHPLERNKAGRPEGNLDIGKGQGDYLTHYQNIHTDKFNQRQNNRLSNEDINKLKGQNFKTGYQGTNYNTSSQEYGRSNGPVNKLSSNTLQSMRNTNIVQSDYNPFKGGTTYKDSFLWKKGEQ